MGIFAITDSNSLKTVYVGVHDTEADAWTTYLGFPTRDEIVDAKMKFVCREVVMYPVGANCRS
jgi:hypothetical protein